MTIYDVMIRNIYNLLSVIFSDKPNLGKVVPSPWFGLPSLKQMSEDYNSGLFRIHCKLFLSYVGTTQMPLF
jgi:hypothetical protein